MANLSPNAALEWQSKDVCQAVKSQSQLQVFILKRSSQLLIALYITTKVQITLLDEVLPLLLSLHAARAKKKIPIT